MLAALRGPEEIRTLAFTGYRKLFLTKVPVFWNLAKSVEPVAISRGDLTEKIMANNWICSRHFINGKPAPLEHESNPDWLPTQNLGHCKVLGNPVQIAERLIRRKATEDARSDTNEDVLVSSMSSTTAASSRDKAVEGLLALTSSSFSANGVI